MLCILRRTFAVTALLITVISNCCAQRVNSVERWAARHTVEREIPNAAGHPGNVFLLGQMVVINTPDAALAATHYLVTDEMGRAVRAADLDAGAAATIELGKLKVGWYRVAWWNSAHVELAWTTAAVLTPLIAPTPQNSPICVDSATAWFAERDEAKQQKLSQLAALAGTNWVRDRMRWRDVQPARDTWSSDTSYDSSATIQHDHGLKVLQVYHDTPAWATSERRSTGRFPTDLRHVHKFAQAMSRRYAGRVQAWEPWNEANVATFGGHTIDEICSYQKAAYLGFKAGDPDVTVCWNATTGIPTERQTDGVLRNESWSYFDTYNIHAYDWADEYARLWQPARRAACGKPLWITESDRGMAYEEGSPTQDLSDHDQRLKAQYVTQSYVQSLYAGAQRHFHFILGQYVEGKTQFGLLRHDMTPRAGYVALAALGRLLAGACCLGRYETTDTRELHVYAFRARPAGQERDVLVVWAEKNVDWPARGKVEVAWTVPESLQIAQTWDYLGRELPNRRELAVTSSPLFLVLPKEACHALQLTLPPTEELRVDAPSPIVLQCAMPQTSEVKLERIPWAWEYEHAITPNRPELVRFFVYNFSQETVKGSVRFATLPDGCQGQPHEWQVELEPLQRQELTSRFTISDAMTGEAMDNWIVLRGDFPPHAPPVVALRLIAVAD